MNKLTLTLGIFCLGFLLAACEESSLYPNDPAPKPQSSGTQGLSTIQITNREWQLQSFEVVGGAITPITDGREYSLVFTGPRTFMGHADCNEMYGTYTSGTTDGISIDPVLTTRIFCGSDSRNIDYTEALGRATSYKATSVWLRIFYDNNTKVLNFVPKQQIIPTDEAQIQHALGKVWQLDSVTVITGAGLTREVVKVPDGQSITLRFDEYDKVSGTVDCNTYSGRLTVSTPNTAPWLSILDVSSTEVACGVQNSVEQNYYELLWRVNTYSINLNGAGQLVLRSPDDAYMTFTLKQQQEPDFGVNTLQELVGMRLLLKEYGETNGARTRVQSSQTPSLTMVNGSWLAGTGFCGNIFSGDYQTSAGNKVTLSNWAGTPGTSCGSYDVMLFDALQSATSYQIAGNRLEIYYNDGANVLVYVKGW